MLKLKLQYFGHLMWRADSSEKTLMLGRDWGQEEKGTTEDEMGGWHHWLNGWWVWVNSRSWWWTGRPGMLQFMGSQRVGHNWATELNWTELNKILIVWKVSFSYSQQEKSWTNWKSSILRFVKGLRPKDKLLLPKLERQEDTENHVLPAAEAQQQEPVLQEYFQL